MTPRLFLCPILILRLVVVERILTLIADFFVIDNLLCASDEQNALAVETVAELPEDFVLGFFCKVDKHVTAHNHMKVFRIRVL